MVWVPAPAQDGHMSSEDPSLMPPTSNPWTALRGLVRRGGRVFGLVLLALVGAVLIKGMFEPYGLFNVDDGFLFAIVLVGAGVLLLRGHESGTDAAAIVRPRNPRSPLGALTLSAGFCICGLMILLGNLRAAEVDISQIAATGLFVVGTGLLIGSWWGRARILIVIGIVLVPLVVMTAFIPFPVRGSVGDTDISPVSIEEVDQEYEILVGSLSLNLLPVEEQLSDDFEIDLTVAAGRVSILVPQRMGLTVNGHIGYGNATVGHGREQGEDLSFHNEIPGAPGAGHLKINFKGGIASLYVERISYRELYGRTRAQVEAEQRRVEEELQRVEERQERRREVREEEPRAATKQRRQRIREGRDG